MKLSEPFVEFLHLILDFSHFNWNKCNTWFPPPVISVTRMERWIGLLLFFFLYLSLSLPKFPLLSFSLSFSFSFFFSLSLFLFLSSFFFLSLSLSLSILCWKSQRLLISTICNEKIFEQRQMQAKQEDGDVHDLVCENLVVEYPFKCLSIHLLSLSLSPSLSSSYNS